MSTCPGRRGSADGGQRSACCAASGSLLLSNQVPRTGPHVTPASSLNQTFRPVLPQLQPAHLILTILPYHLQGTLGDQRGLQNHLGEDPAQKRGGFCWRRAARQPISLWPTCTPASSALGPELQTGTEADVLLPPDALFRLLRLGMEPRASCVLGRDPTA